MCHGAHRSAWHYLDGLLWKSVNDPTERRRFVEIFRRGSDEFRAELTEFSRKQDYRFQHEGLSEGQATFWRRAVCRLVGEPLPSPEPPR